ncbi:hypothetical protein AGABI1DRAFT_115846, partial [Agaricus bisporus var. burnettii JB137-S8]
MVYVKPSSMNEYMRRGMGKGSPVAFKNFKASASVLLTRAETFTIQGMPKRKTRI